MNVFCNILSSYAHLVFPSTVCKKRVNKVLLATAQKSA